MDLEIAAYPSLVYDQYGYNNIANVSIFCCLALQFVIVSFLHRSRDSWFCLFFTYYTKQLRGNVAPISEAQVKAASMASTSMHSDAIELSSIGSIARPYKPKFHKAAFYHSNHTGSQLEQYESSANTSSGKRKLSTLAADHRDNNIENGFSLIQHQHPVKIYSVLY